MYHPLWLFGFHYRQRPDATDSTGNQATESQQRSSEELLRWEIKSLEKNYGEKIERVEQKHHEKITSLEKNYDKKIARLEQQLGSGINLAPQTGIFCNFLLIFVYIHRFKI